MEISKNRSKFLFLSRETSDLVLHFKYRVAVFRSKYPQFLHFIFKHQLFLDSLITRTECLDLGISECLLVHIFAFSRRSLTCHDLRDEFLLVLQCLIAVCIERAFSYIAEDLNILVLVALTNNSSGALLQICGAPRYIKVMDGDKPFLYVSTRTHFCRRTEQNTNLTITDFIKKIGFLLFSFRIVNVCNFLRRDTPCDQLVTNIVINTKIAFFLQ